MSNRDRIAKAIMDQRAAMERPSLPLDDFRMSGDAPYREDRPGMIGQIERRLQGPMVGPEIDPHMAPAPEHMLGVSPTNDPAVYPPEILPGMMDEQNTWWKA
jgi:hypothetical protein